MSKEPKILKVEEGALADLPEAHHGLAQELTNQLAGQIMLPATWFKVTCVEFLSEEKTDNSVSLALHLATNDPRLRAESFYLELYVTRDKNGEITDILSIANEGETEFTFDALSTMAIFLGQSLWQPEE